MTLKLRCQDYGFECDFVLDGAKSMTLLEKLRVHFTEEHGIEYTTEVITQMIVNRGHSLDSILKD
jgi:predicted small metal-binding protein